MDLQTATILSGQKWQFARVTALIFLLLTCGLLASSLPDRQTMNGPHGSAPTWGMH